MSGRLSGLKASLRADREPPKKAEATSIADEAPRKSTRAKARENKRGVVGYYSPELQRTLNIMATERDTTLQAILGEAIDSNSNNSVSVPKPVPTPALSLPERMFTLFPEP